MARIKSLFLVIVAGGALWLMPKPSFGDTIVAGDIQVTGQLGIGMAVPQAAAHVLMDSGDSYALKVSSPDGTALMAVDRTGKLGIGLTSPSAKLDVRGSADNGDLGLNLRAGNSSSTTSSSQLVFSCRSTQPFSHSIRTRAAAEQNLGNSMDFFLWNSTGQPNTLGSLEVLSLMAMATTQYASVHVLPVPGDPGVELAVSDGSTLGGGTIHSGSMVILSSRKFKSDIEPLGSADEEKAFEDVKALKHARFRYKASGREDRGLIYEDAPASIRGPGRTIVFNERLLNLEMTLKEANRRIKQLEAQISSLERR